MPRCAKTPHEPDQLDVSLGTESVEAPEHLLEWRELCEKLRRAHSWDQVLHILAAYDYTLMPFGDDIFVVNFYRRRVFVLWECGHNRQVFEERLGPFPFWSPH